MCSLFVPFSVPFRVPFVFLRGFEAQGSCALTAEKRFPKLPAAYTMRIVHPSTESRFGKTPALRPKKKVVCVKAFCIMFMLQFVAELEMNGILTGTVEVGAYVDFDIAGTVTVDKLLGAIGFGQNFSTVAVILASCELQSQGRAMPT